MKPNHRVFWLGWIIAFAASGASAGVLATFVYSRVTSLDSGGWIVASMGVVMIGVGIWVWQMWRHLRTTNTRLVRQLVFSIGGALAVTLCPVFGIMLFLYDSRSFVELYMQDSRTLSPLMTAYLLPVGMAAILGLGTGIMAAISAALFCLWERWRQRPIDHIVPGTLILFGGIIVGVASRIGNQSSPWPLLTNILSGVACGTMYALAPGWVLARFWWRDRLLTPDGEHHSNDELYTH